MKVDTIPPMQHFFESSMHLQVRADASPMANLLAKPKVTLQAEAQRAEALKTLLKVYQKGLLPASEAH